MARKTIRVEALARVEGEGGLTIKYRGQEVASVELRIFEPPRFFEAFLRGRPQLEVPDITARICGICPVAYQTSSMAAMEDACGVVIPDGIRVLRRLLYCGEWIESHTLHVFFLHAPDFLGYTSAFEMARDHRAVVDVRYDTKTYSIKYKDSSNLQYDGTSIHKNYNGWIQNLDNAIRARLTGL